MCMRMHKERERGMRLHVHVHVRVHARVCEAKPGCTSSPRGLPEPLRLITVPRGTGMTRGGVPGLSLLRVLHSNIYPMKEPCMKKPHDPKVYAHMHAHACPSLLQSALSIKHCDSLLPVALMMRPAGCKQSMCPHSLHARKLCYFRQCNAHWTGLCCCVMTSRKEAHRLEGAMKIRAN